MGFRDAPIGLGEEHRGALRDTDGAPPFTHPPLYLAERMEDRRQC